jgi:ketosteroid isomerase-like protein
MPETTLATVRRFYEALAAKDGAGLTALVSAQFAENAYVEWPRSLPYGGRIEGAAKLARVFGRMADSPVSVGATRVELADLIDGGERVGALLDFDYLRGGEEEAIRTRALELWTFEAGKVASVEAFYWDTGALITPSSA